MNGARRKVWTSTLGVGVLYGRGLLISLAIYVYPYFRTRFSLTQALALPKAILGVKRCASYTVEELIVQTR